MVTNAMTIVIANIRVKITTENAIKSDAIENGTEIEERNEEDPNPDHATANVAEHAVDHVTNTADHRDHVTEQSGTADHRAADHVTSTAVARGAEVAPARARPMDATEVTAANLSNAPSLRWSMIRIAICAPCS
jgi:hypothetical protein